MLDKMLLVRKGIYIRKDQAIKLEKLKKKRVIMNESKFIRQALDEALDKDEVKKILEV